MLAFLAITLVVVAVGFMAWYTRRRRRTGSERLQDWWPDFECAFWAYVRDTNRAPRSRDRHGHGRGM
jgi:hypothetical protein